MFRGRRQRDLDALLHIHVCETQDEGAELEAQHGGKSTIEILAQHGILDGKVLAAHSVWVNEEGIETYAQKNVGVAHCPVSNMNSLLGLLLLCPCAAGVEVGLATDGPASNDDLDLWQEINLAPLLTRATALDAATMTPRDALTMATTEGARVIGNGDTGVLQIGAKADFIRLELDNPTFVPVTNDDELIAHVAWSGSGRHA